MRLAGLKHAGDLSSRLPRLLLPLEAHVTDDLRLLSDGFSERMFTPLMVAVLARHAPALRRVFSFYAAADRSLSPITQQGKLAMETVNVKEMHELCEAAHLFDATYGVREMIAAFVRVNVDDEVYVQTEAANTSSTLVYDEFEETLARIYAGRVWERLDEPARLEPESFERGFHEWLTELLPVLTNAIKLRKRAGPGVSTRSLLTVGGL